MMFHILILLLSVLALNCKSIMSINTTSTYPTEISTKPDLTTVSSTQSTTTVSYKEETTKTTVQNNKPYVFHSNFSRNNDSIFVALHSNISDVFVSINNTFVGMRNASLPCELLFNEHSNKIIISKIVINFNGSLTRDLAVQLGDRLMDMVDLLATVRSMINQNNTVDVV